MNLNGETFAKTHVQRNKDILLKADYFEEALNLELLIEQINKNKFHISENSFSLDSEEQMFLKAIVLMRRSKFDEAILQLESISPASFDSQVQLLRLDCLFELDHSINFLNEYQNLYNTVDDNKIRLIIKERFKFVRYEN